MNKMDLMKDVGISSGTAVKMTKDEPVSMMIPERICDELNCDVGDLVRPVNEKGSETK